MRELWAKHGTKILGWFEVAVGIIEYVDAQTINLIGGALGPHAGPIVSKALQIGAGLAVARRGVINQRRLAAAQAAAGVPPT